MTKYKLASFFAGIGGIDLGFEKSGIESVWANDIDHTCQTTYSLNFPKKKFVLDDISNIKGKDIPSVDIIAGGFPCQPFSIAGHRKGFEDDRGGLFFQITRIIEEMDKNNNKPKVIFLENVKNLFTHENGETYLRIKDELKKLGYIVFEKILNTNDYGNLPQNRERLFIVAFLDITVADKFKWPHKVKLSNSISELINWDATVNEKYYYTKDNLNYDLLLENVNKPFVVYQYRRVYVRENKSGMCPTLTANMGMGGHNVPIIQDSQKRIRKLTPRECLSLQGFGIDYMIPSNLADSRIYKQAGNSVSVTVIEAIASQIKKALDEVYK